MMSWHKLTFIKLLFLVVNSTLLEAQVDMVGDKFFALNYEENSVNLPVFSNLDLNEDNFGINKVIVVMHGLNRNAYDYYSSVEEITSSLGLQNETHIIAPQFLLLEDIEHWSLGPTIPYWQNNTGWITGNQSLSTLQHPRDFLLSSYTIIDSLLSGVIARYSDVEDIIFVGNSAGGQLLNRFAGGSPATLDEKIKFIISAPSSFLYFDENRYEYPNSWTQPTGCINYNNYKYGLDELNNYMSVASGDSIIARYHNRNITYLVGGLDYGGTTDCQSMVQGQNRLERSLTYYNYLQYYFGEQITNTHNIAIINEVNHNYDEIFSSACGRKTIFGHGHCEQIDNLTGPSAQFTSDATFGNYPLVANFTSNSIEGTHKIKYHLWQIEDESIYATENLEYTFNYPGTYNASLIVIDEIGQRDTTMNETIITVDTLFGDVNFDAQINTVDVEDILIHSIGNISFDAAQLAAGDLDNDDTLSPFDASLILQYLDNNISQIPLEENQEFTAFGGLKELEVPGNIDEIIQIPIVLENAENIYSFKATINFDPNFISSATIYSADIAESGFLIESKIEEDGKILIAGATSTAANNEIEIGNFYFIPLGFPNGQNILFCENLNVNNLQMGGSFNIKITQTLALDSHLSVNNFSLGNNFPNPFNATTKIMLNLNKNLKLKIQIHNTKGQLVRSLTNDYYEKGPLIVEWDGKNDEGSSVVSGAYFYMILTENKTITKKMLFVK